MGLSEDDRSICGLYVWCGSCVAYIFDVVHEKPLCIMFDINTWNENVFSIETLYVNLLRNSYK